MTALVIILVLVVLAVSILYPNIIGDRIALVLMTPVLIYALVFFFKWSNPNFAILALHAFIGLIVGAGVLVVLLPLSSENPKKFITQTRKGIPVIFNSSENLLGIAINCAYIVYEELVWRVFMVTALTSLTAVWISVPIAALSFWYSHEDNREWSGHSCEFILFSFIITIAFALTGSLTLVLCIHLARNVLIFAQHYGTANHI